MKNKLTTLFIVLSIFLTWELVIKTIDRIRIIENKTSISFFVASPSEIITSFVKNWDVIFFHFFETISRAGIGLVLGIILAFLISTLFLYNPKIKSIIFPINLAINSFPIIGFVPVIILIFGQGSDLSIIFISMVISYFPVLIQIDQSHENVSSNLVETIQTFGATRSQLIKKVFIPLSFPSMFTALRLAIPASIIGATIGEWLGSGSGIGYLITMSLYQLKPSLMYASLISITIFSVLLVLLINKIKISLFPWNRPTKIN